MTDKIVILSTCANEQEAEKLARALLDARLAACVSVVPRARSFYHWKGAIESAEECLLVIKSSRGEYFGQRISRIAANDLHLQVQRGHASEEVMIPFVEIKEIRLQHKDAR